MTHIIGKFYGFVLLQDESEQVQIQQGVNPPFKEKYASVEDAKNQIRNWKKKDKEG